MKAYPKISFETEAITVKAFPKKAFPKARPPTNRPAGSSAGATMPVTPPRRIPKTPPKGSGPPGATSAASRSKASRSFLVTKGSYLRPMPFSAWSRAKHAALGRWSMATMERIRQARGERVAKWHAAAAEAAKAPGPVPPYYGAAAPPPPAPVPTAPPSTEAMRPEDWLNEQVPEYGEREPGLDLPGSTDDGFENPTPALTLDTSRSSLPLDPAHWSRATIMCRRVRGSIIDRLDLNDSVGVDDLTADQVYLVLLAAGISPLSCSPALLRQGPEFIPTPGQYFYYLLNRTVVETMNSFLTVGTGLDPQAVDSADGDWQHAYHGTSMSCLSHMLTFGLVPGPNMTHGKYGVYCEGAARRTSCLNYMTHEQGGGHGNPNHVFSAIIHLMVDRSRGMTANRQWVQPPGTFMILGYFVHAINLSDVLSHGFGGWFRIANGTLVNLRRVPELS